MKLDSARELKLALSSQLLSALAAPIRMRALAGPARAISIPDVTAPEAQMPTIALGVVPHKRGDFRLAVRVQRRALEQSRELELIRKQAKGEVEVRYIGRVLKRAPWYQEQQRPLRIGCSVGHYKITAGTLGCFVRPRAGGDIAVLSNNHVLANENHAKKGDVILQPGAYDGGKNPADGVAKLSNFIRIKRTGANLVDCAMASVNSGIQSDLTKITGLGKLAGLGAAFVDEGTKVSKLGRTTGLTQGRVTAFELDNVVIEYDIGHLRFDNQLEIESDGDGPFSQGGDSGSLIVDKDLLGVGLLFAGSDQGGANEQGLTYANPLRTVLDALKINLVS
jgi:hypothetical protein